MVVGQFVPDDLINGDFSIVPEAIMVPAGTQAFKRGTVLDSDFAPVTDETADDADRIALEDCDASGSSPVRCVTALTGGFNTNQLHTGDNTDPSSLKKVLRGKCIFIRRGLADGN